MVNPIDIYTLLGQEKSLPVIDVRTPAEFKKAHIPGAINIPLFTNEERVEVGTTYKQKGREKAILLGFDLVGSKWRRIIETALKLIPNKKLCVHCWRGGMRSGVVSWALDLYGFEVYQLEGGYKAYRKWVLNQFDRSYPLIVLGGMTGSRKTDILKSIRKKGVQMIDLEDLAHHQGSAFGTKNYLKQASQEQFENDLAQELSELNPETPIWVEDESRNIGHNVLPENIWSQMRSTCLLKLEWPYEKRLKYLTEEYGTLDKAFLKDAASHIQKRLGPQHYKAALAALENDEIQEFVRIVLVYYDKAYQYGLSKRDSDKIYTLNLQDENMADAATKVLDFGETNLYKNLL